MKKEYLLSMLQDIVEESGEFMYLNNRYAIEKNIRLDIIQNIIIYGLKNKIFEVYKHINSNKNSYIKIDENESIPIVNDKKSWERWPEFYEVSFIDTNKYIWILFGDEIGNNQRIPEEFLEFVVD